MKKLVCLDAATLYPAGDHEWNRFADIAATVEIYDRTAPDQTAARCAGADVVLTNKVAIGADIMDACPEIRYIGVLATGYNIVDTAAARERGITVANIPAYSTMSVAQTAIALLLALTNRVEHYTRRIEDGAWVNSPDFSFTDFAWHELTGKTMAIVGFGNIGRAVAAIAAAMGMKIMAVTSKPAESLPEGYVKANLDTAFATADIVSLHCPLTPDTAGMVNARRLASMKRDAIIINTARGGLVDEAALADALHRGVIAGAGLDVLSSEPPAHSNPMLSAPNTVLTPHIGWASFEARRRLFEIALGNLRAFAEGKPANTVI
ncbi:MAG: D-2-hydroxyacid dehydrogenase [Muribaculaceae bacterium]|nr:D-2-hydroxyacid dehydrogenase [Muribaculaceae bacterium]